MSLLTLLPPVMFVAALASNYQPMPPHCAAQVDAYCANVNNPDLKVCYDTMRKEHLLGPLITGYSGPGDNMWRCYHPSSLAGPDPAAMPVLDRRFTKGNAFCTKTAQISDILAGCWVKAKVVEVFPPTAAIPSLVYAPPDDAAGLPNGSLVAFAQDSGDGIQGALCSKVSTDHGATWSANIYPPVAAGLPVKPGPRSFWCCPQTIYNPHTKAIVLQFSNSTTMKGGCDLGEEQLGGMLQLSSYDGGKTWGKFVDIQKQIEAGGAPSCLAPTSGAGLVMRPVGGKYEGRLVFCAVRNAYQGDIVYWSDDGGKTYNFSTGVYKHGLDECNIAQATNGSLFMISRSCKTYPNCQMLSTDDLGNSSVGDGPGSHRFAVATSDDGGETWSPISYHPQLVTPVCQGSVISYQGPSDKAPALYYSSPYSTRSRINGTILASDDNGKTFPRSLNVFPYGMFGYTGLACGMNGKYDCGVLFDNGGRLDFLGFHSADVKSGAVPDAEYI